MSSCTYVPASLVCEICVVDDALSCGAEEALMVADSENMAAEDAWQLENPASVTNPASREANALARIVFMVVDFLPELF